MQTEGIELTAVIGFPDEDVAIAVGSREQDAIRAEVGTRDPLGVLGDDVQLFARGDVVALHLLGVGADDDLAVVRGDVGRHDLVEFLPHFRDPLAGLDVPDHGMPQFTPAAASHDQQRPVGAELERTGMAFGVRQDPGQLMLVGVVKEYLLLTRDGEERGPRAGRHGHHGGRARRHDDGLE